MSQKLLKTVLFVVLFLAVFFLSDEIFRWKDYHYQTYPNSATVSGFYRMKRNSVDVIFLGSSQGVTAFNPQVVYDECGIRSYNLSTEQQSLVVSYYLLKEALKYQSPKAVILDVWMCFGNRNPLNSAESCVRKVVDQMKWSPLKKEFIWDICRLWPDLKKSSFYFKNVRYRGRWKSLRAADFEFSALEKPMSTKGYAAQMHPWKTEKFSPIEIKGDEPSQPMSENMAAYLSKIAKLCRKKGIPLILVKTPNIGWNPHAHQAIREVSEKYGIRFYDFNEENLYRASGFDYATDGTDGHLDNTGARKVSRFLGTELLREYGVESHLDVQWESSRSTSNHIDVACFLPHCSDIHEYLSLLENQDFAVFLAIKDDGTAGLDGDVVSKLSALGVRTNLLGQYRKSFCFASGTDRNCEEVSDHQIWCSGTVCSGRVVYKVMSAGWNCGNDCSITINGGEYAKRSRGLNIVVYSPVLRRVVDSVCFDTFDSAMSCVR